jgi:hypothetical protein
LAGTRNAESTAEAVAARRHDEVARDHGVLEQPRLHEIRLGHAELLERRSQLAVVEHGDLQRAIDRERLREQLGHAFADLRAALLVLLRRDRVARTAALTDDVRHLAARRGGLGRRAADDARGEHDRERSPHGAPPWCSWPSDALGFDAG